MYRIEIYIKITYDFLSTSFRVTDLPSLYIHTFTRRKGAAHRRWRSNRQRDHQRHRCFSHSQKAAPEPLHTYIHARGSPPRGQLQNQQSSSPSFLSLFLSLSVYHPPRAQGAPVKKCANVRGPVRCFFHPFTYTWSVWWIRIEVSDKNCFAKFRGLL